MYVSKLSITSYSLHVHTSAMLHVHSTLQDKVEQYVASRYLTSGKMTAFMKLIHVPISTTIFNASTNHNVEI